MLFNPSRLGNIHIGIDFLFINFSRLIFHLNKCLCSLTMILFLDCHFKELKNREILVKF